MSTMSRDVREIVRDEHLMRRRILQALEDGPLTVPEIAAAIGAPTHEVDVLGHGHAQVRLPRRDQGSHRRRLLPVRSRGEGEHERPRQPQPGERGRHSAAFNAVGLHELRRVHGDLPDGASKCCPAGCSATCCSGMEDRVLAETETIYSCLLCKLCEENCPAGVHIAENVRSLAPLTSTTGPSGFRRNAMPLPTGDVIGILARQPAPARVGAADLAQERHPVGRGLGPAPGRRDRPLHRPDVSAHPLHRRSGQGRAAPGRHAPGTPRRARPTGQPARERDVPGGSALRPGARRLRPGPHQRGPAPPAGRGRVRLPLRGRPVLGGARPRPGRWTRSWPNTLARSTASSEVTGSRT